MLTHPRTLDRAVEDAASSEQTGFRFLGSSAEATFVSYAQIERDSARWGAALQAMGARRGDRVALLLGDHRELILALFGAVRAGAVPVPVALPTGLGRGERALDHALAIVARSDAAFVLGDARLASALAGRLPAGRRLVTPADVDAVTAPLHPAALAPDDVCLLQFSSGSTGRPRGVVVSHANVAANTRAMVEHLQRGLGLADGEGHAASWLPLYHDMGLIGCVLAPLYHRFTVTFLSPTAFLRRPARWLEVISRYRADMSFAPSSGYGQCVTRVRDQELAGLDLSSWRVAGCGAEPISVPVLRAFARRFAPCGFDERAFLGSYGLAESTLAVSFAACNAGLQVAAHEGQTLAACGAAFPDHEIAVFAPDDAAARQPLPDRVVGEVRVRGPSVAAGYWDDPTATAAAYGAGWLRTGDLGYLDGGQLYVCGRIKEIIIVHGRNHYPQDLEWAACQVPGVRADGALAFATRGPAADADRVVLAFETGVKDPAELAALTRRVGLEVAQATGLPLDETIPLAPGALPRTTSGKLQRVLTRQRFEAGLLRPDPAAPSSTPAATPAAGGGAAPASPGRSSPG